MHRVFCREASRRRRRILGMDLAAASSHSHISGLVHPLTPPLLVRQFLAPPHSSLPVVRLGGAPISHASGFSSRMPLLCHYSVGGGDSGGSNNNNNDDGGSKKGGGGGGGDEDEDEDEDDDGKEGEEGGSEFGILGGLLRGWRERVAADPQFPFKVVMEELVGVSACVLGDMASRPNFGLDELDFVFSTLVVGAILNFTLMYLLAPTLSASVPTLPGLFKACPTSHMFESGPYSMSARLGTFVYKGAIFAAVGFAAGLVGTAISNGLISMRKKMDPKFETPNKPPPTVLNALTWAAHMGISSNLRYQTLNGAEFLLAKALPPFVFKTSVVGLRCLNNVLGGMSFVILARLTGSQSVAAASPPEGDSQPSSSKVISD